MIEPERIKILNTRAERRGKYVLYWMQQSQRADWNHALEYAITEANRLRVPVLAAFGLTQNFPDANARHYRFMLHGLRETQRELKRSGIKLAVKRAEPDDAALSLADDAALIVCDRGYLRVQKEWRRSVAERAPCRVVQVESDVVVPVETASNKEEYAARTLRPKLHREMERFLVPVVSARPARSSLSMKVPDIVELADIDAILRKLKIDKSVSPAHFIGGASEANRLLDEFITDRLRDYDDRHGDPAHDYESQMSAYLHFGQISPLEIAMKVLAARVPATARDAFLEQLIVRRELSMNFVNYNPAYDSYDCLPDWAKRTFAKHRRDKRSTYSLEEWELAKTHDALWNAAQHEMLVRGKMHNYMRMYWGKKIIEHSASPEEAFRVALYLNNKYELDGRDSNGFAGVAWCFGKHDRPWRERPIFGTVRYMSESGLRTKFHIEKYVERVAALERKKSASH